MARCSSSTKLFKHCLLAVVVLALSGCSTELKTPDLAGIYNAAAKDHGPDTNPVIVIPGILGSKLRDPESKGVVWGAFTSATVKPNKPDGARLIALPMKDGASLAALRDEIITDGALDRVKVNFFGIRLRLSAYFQILATLGAGGFRDEMLGEAGAIDYGPDHFTCFQFAYDWRRSNAENAKALGEFIAEKRGYVQQKYREKFGLTHVDVKFNIVAHSMGGLLTRYYLRYGSQPLPQRGGLPKLTWAGTRHVDKVILVGTPNAGSVDSLGRLTKGLSVGPISPKYPAALLGTMPAIYELLPRNRHQIAFDARSGQRIDHMDPKTWETYGWGLADPKQDDVLAMLLPDVSDPRERRRIALDHLAKCLANAKQFHRALDRPVKSSPGVEIRLFAGDSEETARQVAVEADGNVVVTRNAPGDGTVLRSSAIMDEREGRPRQSRLVSPIPWRDVNFLFADHIGTTKDPHFSDNLLFLLLEE